MLKRFVEFMQVKLAPFGARVANQRHLQAISGGLAAMVPLTLIGAIFNIISTPPVTEEIANNAWIFSGLLKGWISLATNYGGILKIPYNMTMNLFGLLVSFTIAYKLAASYKMSALSNGIISLCIFFMVAAPMTTGVLSSTIAAGGDTVTSVIAATNLGTVGIFGAMIIALVSVEITRFSDRKGLKLTLPDSVPPSVAQAFSSIIPLILNIIILFGFNVLLLSTTGFNLIDGITKVLSPGLEGVNTPWGMALLISFGMFLWFFGIHGMALVYPLIMPLSIQLITQNAELVAAGQEPIFHAVHTFSYALIGGSGSLIGLVILMLRSKSEQLKVVGKAGAIPALFGINEPIIFGAPVMLNPIMLIPLIFSPVFCATLGYIAGSLGWIEGSYIYLKAYLPIGVGAAIQAMSIKNFIFSWILVPISIVIWYPFFKAYEKQLVDSEQKNAATASS